MTKKNEIIVDGKVVDESEFQRVCGRYVERNVLCCVSSLMTDIGRNLETCTDIFNLDYDEAVGWFSRPDYETAATWFIDNDADLDDLETIAEEHGYWSEVIAEVQAELGDGLLKLLCVEFADSDEFEDQACYWAADEPHAIEQFKSEFANYRELEVSNIEEEEDLEEWVAHQPEAMILIRKKVSKLVNTDEEYQWVCSQFDLEPENDEVYEHWVVSERFGDELKNQGLTVFEFGNMLIWGRGTTGMSISLDYCVRRIVMKLSEHHYVWD